MLKSFWPIFVSKLDNFNFSPIIMSIIGLDDQGMPYSTP